MRSRKNRILVPSLHYALCHVASTRVQYSRKSLHLPLAMENEKDKKSEKRAVARRTKVYKLKRRPRGGNSTETSTGNSTDKAESGGTADAIDEKVRCVCVCCRTLQSSLPPGALLHFTVLSTSVLYCLSCTLWYSPFIPSTMHGAHLTTVLRSAIPN